MGGLADTVTPVKGHEAEQALAGIHAAVGLACSELAPSRRQASRHAWLSVILVWCSAAWHLVHDNALHQHGAAASCLAGLSCKSLCNVSHAWCALPRRHYRACPSWLHPQPFHCPQKWQRPDCPAMKVLPREAFCKGGVGPEVTASPLWPQSEQGVCKVVPSQVRSPAASAAELVPVPEHHVVRGL